MMWKLIVSFNAQIPGSCFKVAEYTNPPNPMSTHILKAHTGNFIPTPASFDNELFNISPCEAQSMDPQQHVLLHTACETLENAGYLLDATPSFCKEGVGCCVSTTTRFVQNLRMVLPQLLPYIMHIKL
jgi:acyl transferase domain-containing protein